MDNRTKDAIGAHDVIVSAIYHLEADDDPDTLAAVEILDTARQANFADLSAAWQARQDSQPDWLAAAAE